MKIISIVNTKGGVGKTVTAINLGSALARAGGNVLIIDMDLQGGLASYFDLPTESVPTTADVLTGGAGLDEAAQQIRPNLWAVPATAQMEHVQVELAAASGGEVRLRRAVRRFNEQPGELPLFDYVLIDCPSGWGAVTRNALLASHAMVVPVNSEPAAVTLAVATIASAAELSEYHDHQVHLLGVLLTRFRATNAARAIERQAETIWGPDLFTARIRQAEKINELGITGETTSDGGAGPVGADYAALATEVASRAAAL